MYNTEFPMEFILDQCLTAVLQGKKSVSQCLADYPEVADELEPMLTLALRFKAAGELRAPEDFRKIAKIRMLNLVSARVRSVPSLSQKQAYANSLLKKQAKRSGLAWSLRIWATALAFILVLMVALTGGVAFASAKAMPGQPFYPAKIFYEKVQLTLSDTDIGDSQLYLAFAQNRMFEAANLTSRDRISDVDPVLTEYTIHVLQSLSLFSEPNHLSTQDYYLLASRYAQDLTLNEEFLRNLLSRNPVVDTNTLQLAITASRNGRRYLSAAILENPLVLQELQPILASPGGLPIDDMLATQVPGVNPTIEITDFPTQASTVWPTISSTQSETLDSLPLQATPSPIGPLAQPTLLGPMWPTNYPSILSTLWPTVTDWYEVIPTLRATARSYPKPTQIIRTPILPRP